MAAVVVLFCFLISFGIWYLILNAKSKNKLPPLADGGLPLLGHTLTFLLNKREKLYEIIFEKMLTPMLKRGIDVTRLSIGFWEAYIILNPEDGYLLANACLEKDTVYDLLKPFYGEGLVTSPVSLWKKQRKILSSTFNQRVLDGFLTEFNRTARQLVRDLSVEVGRGPFDQCSYMKNITLEQICMTAMGVRVADRKEERGTGRTFGADLGHFHTCVTERFLRVHHHSDFLFSLSNLKKRQHAAVQNLRHFTETVLQKRRQTLRLRKTDSVASDLSKPTFQPLVDLLLSLSEDGHTFTDEQIRDHVNTFIAAGSDTTANALSNILLMLGSHPEVQQKLYEEIMEVFLGSDRDVEKQDLSKLKYTEAVVKETLRLYPVVAVVVRRVHKQLKLKRYVVPAGSRCVLSLHSMCRHAAWGADADAFRPERWLEPAALPVDHNAFAVFSLGRRNCIGGKYSLTSLKTMLVHLTRRYRVTDGDVTKARFMFDVTTWAISGHHIAIENRFLQTE